MKFRLIALLAALAGSALAQQDVRGPRNFLAGFNASASDGATLPFKHVTGDPSGACALLDGWLYNTSTGVLWRCFLGTWTQFAPGGPGGGGVSSVALSMPATEFSVTGTPITSNGTLAVGWTNQVQNRVFAAPSSIAGTPTFRALVAADIPALSYEPPITAGLTSQYRRGDKTWQTLDTLAVAENTNLYFTNARARLSLSASNPMNYNNVTGAFSLVLNVNRFLTVDGSGLGLSPCSVDGQVPKYNLSSATWNCADDVGASGSLGDPGSSGGVYRTTLGNTVARSIACGTGLTCTNGDGQAGNPTVTPAIATQLEAEQGVVTNKLMTPERTAQAIAAQAALPVQTGQANAVLTTDGSVSLWTQKYITTPQSVAVVAGTTITPTRRIVCLTATGNTIMTSVPTLADPPAEGEVIDVGNCDSGTDTITLQDHSVLNNSNIRLNGHSGVMAVGEWLRFIYVGSEWRAIGKPGAGGGAAPQTKTYMAAKCQNTVAGAGFNVPVSNAPTALCDFGATQLFGVLRFTALNQEVYDAFPLPDTFSAVALRLTGRTASTAGNSSWSLQTACVGNGEPMGTGGSGGPAWNAAQDITLAASGTANQNVVSGELSVTTTGCAANELFMWRLYRNSSTNTTNPELVSLSFKVQ